MKGPLKLLVAALLLPGLSFAQSRRPPRRAHITDRDMMFSCPLEVSAACQQRCSGQDPAAACPWAAFGCDFKVCWEGNQHVLRTDLLNVVDDPASYAVPDTTAPPSGINAISEVRITFSGGPELYLLQGRFIAYLYGLEPPAQGRAILQWAQACATLARMQRPDFVARSVNGANPYRVRCGGGRVAFNEIPPAEPTALAQNAVPQQPQAQTGGVILGPGPVQVAPLSNPEADRIHAMNDGELQDYLTATGHVRVDGGRILLDGILPFSPNTPQDQAEAALNQLDENGRSALRILYLRTADRTVQEAQDSSAAPDGQRYVFNDDTGRAELQPGVPGKGPGNGR